MGDRRTTKCSAKKPLFRNAGTPLTNYRNTLVYVKDGLPEKQCIMKTHIKGQRTWKKVVTFLGQEL